MFTQERGPRGYPAEPQAPALPGSHCHPGRCSRPRARPRASCGRATALRAGPPQPVPVCRCDRGHCPPGTEQCAGRWLGGRGAGEVCPSPQNLSGSACPCLAGGGREALCTSQAGGRPEVMRFRPGSGPGWAELPAGWVRGWPATVRVSGPPLQVEGAGTGGGHPPRPCSGPALHPTPRGPGGLAPASLHS